MFTRTLPSSSVATFTATSTPIRRVSSCRKAWASPATVAGSAGTAGATGFFSVSCLGLAGFFAFFSFFSAGLVSAFSSALGACSFSFLGASAFFSAAGFFSEGFFSAGFLAFFSFTGFSSRESANREWVSSTLSFSSSCWLGMMRTIQSRLPKRPNRPLLPSCTSSIVTSSMVRFSSARPLSMASSRVLPRASFTSFILHCPPRQQRPFHPAFPDTC